MIEDRSELAGMIDHTLLKPEATAGDVRGLCDQAHALRVCAVCISPTMVDLAARRLRDSEVKVAAVIGFPSGAHRSEADTVINLGLALAGDWSGVEADIAAVREVLTDGQILKVILETAVLSPEEIVAACHVAEGAGADFVKSSTGFHPAGGATIEAVAIMAAAVDGRLGVKAAGGIRDAATAVRMIEAGATRLGLSATAAILAELDQPIRSI
jgi:deoxyribose-phosphate aldolase